MKNNKLHLIFLEKRNPRKFAKPRMSLKSKYIDNLLYKQREKVKYIYDI